MGIASTRIKTTNNMRTFAFVAFMAVFALSMAAPEAEPKAEAEAEPADYFYGGRQEGPHHQYYRGYNNFNGYYRGQGYNYNGNNGFYSGFNNGYNGYNAYRTYGNGYNYYNYPSYYSGYYTY